jgi:hypothetical protein
MNRWRSDNPGEVRRQAIGKLYRGPLAWIVLLLAGWLVISEWPALASSVLSFAH